MSWQSIDPRQLSLHNDVLHRVVFDALMLSTVAPEHSSATASRRFRGSYRCITMSCTKPHACGIYSYALSDVSPKPLGALQCDSFRELEATIICLTMQLRGADDDAYDALMQEC